MQRGPHQVCEYTRQTEPGTRGMTRALLQRVESVLRGRERPRRGRVTNKTEAANAFTPAYFSFVHRHRNGPCTPVRGLGASPRRSTRTRSSAALFGQCCRGTTLVGCDRHVSCDRLDPSGCHRRHPLRILAPVRIDHRSVWLQRILRPPIGYRDGALEQRREELLRAAGKRRLLSERPDSIEWSAGRRAARWGSAEYAPTLQRRRDMRWWSRCLSGRLPEHRRNVR